MAKASLVKQAQGGELAPVFDRLAKPAPIVADTEVTTLPYLGFKQTTPTNAEKMEAVTKAGVSEGDPYLHRKGKPEKLSDGLRYHLLGAEQFWVSRNDAGATLGVTQTNPNDFYSDYKEDVIAAVIVHADDGPVPAITSFRTGKASAAHPAIDALNDASDDAKWSARGAEFRATLKLSYPFLRFTTHVSLTKKITKGKGKAFYVGKGTVKPTTPGDAESVSRYLATPEGQAAVQSVMAAFDSKCDELRKAVK